MENKVLVTYASKYGATAGIAEKMGEVLNQEGVPADVIPVDEKPDATAYKAVILGSAVYIGAWRKGAARYLQANEKALAGRPVWLFSSGPTEEGDVDELLKGWQFPKKLQPVADRIKPRQIVNFHGSLNREKLNALEKWMIEKVGAEFGDFRDWEAITTWTKAVAKEIKAA